MNNLDAMIQDIQIKIENIKNMFDKQSKLSFELNNLIYKANYLKIK